LLPRKPVVFSGPNDAALLSDEENVLLTTTSNFNRCLTKGYISPNEISVIIFLTTSNTDTGHSTVLKSFSKKNAKQRIVGLVELGLQDVHNASDLKSQLDVLEALYDMPVFMSKDLLAMNAYGEEIAVETFPYSPKNLNPIERNIWKHLNDLSDFLQDTNLATVSESISKLRAVVLWAAEILTTFGLWSFSLMQENIQNTLSQMLKKENNLFVVLAIQTCKTQFDFLQKLVDNQPKTQSLHSCLMDEMLEKLVPYQVLGKSEQDINEHEIAVNLPPNKHVLCENVVQAYLNKQSIGNSTSFKGPEVVKKQIQKLKDKSRFNCIVVTRSNALAKMLSKLINSMSARNAKYSFIKCGCVVQAKNDCTEDEERTESVLQAVRQGMVNVIVTTANQFADLFLTTFNVLIYFGIPSSYGDFYWIKNKVKGFAPKLMFVFNSAHSSKMECNLQV
jgi:hypothetical protein